MAGGMAHHGETHHPTPEEHKKLHKAFTDFLINLAGDGEGKYTMDYEITCMLARK